MTLLWAAPAAICLTFLADLLLTRWVRCKQERMLYRQYFKGLKEGRDESKAHAHELQRRIYHLEGEVRRLHRASTEVPQ